MTIFLCFLCFLLIFIVPLILLEFHKLSKRKLPPGLYNLPPGPKGLPIIGFRVLHSFNQMFRLFFRNLCRKYGPVMLIRFGMDMFVISSKEAAEEYLEGCSRPETDGSQIFSYSFKDPRFAPSGEEWETSRFLVLIELFNTKIQSFRYIREQENELFVKKLSEYASRQSPVNLTKTLFTLVSNMVCGVISGQNLQECKFIDEESIADIVHKFDMVTEYCTFSDLFPSGFGWLIDRIFGPSKRSKKVFSELSTFFQSILDDRLKLGRMVLENPDIIDVMIDMMKKQEKDIDSIKLTTEYLKRIITDIFLAEVYTSVTALVWAMAELKLLPFGSGKKICPEMRMATVELGLLNLLYFLDWGLPKGKRVKDIDLEETGIVTLRKRTAFELVPVLHH